MLGQPSTSIFLKTKGAERAGEWGQPSYPAKVEIERMKEDPTFRWAHGAGQEFNPGSPD